MSALRSDIDHGKILQRCKLPPVSGTKHSSMIRVLRHLALPCHNDGYSSRFRPLDDASVAKTLHTSRRIVCNALAGLETLRVITLLRNDRTSMVCINWYTLRDFVREGGV